jgi:DNA-binding MarR family transcriptional regulator
VGCLFTFPLDETFTLQQLRLQLFRCMLQVMKFPDRMLDHADAIDALRAVGRVRWVGMGLISKQVEEQEGIPYDWFEVLAVIGDEPREAVKMADLADMTLHSKSGMTRLFDRMQKAGLVERMTSEEDRRVVFATLTDRGRALLDRVVEPILDVLIHRFAAHITPEEGRQIVRIFNRVLTANGVEPQTSTRSRIRPNSAPTDLPPAGKAARP